eukprot:267364-Rhodomonas_salina.8
MVSEAQAGAGGAPTVFKAPSATKATSLATAATASTAAATASVKPSAALEAKEEHKTKAVRVEGRGGGGRRRGVSMLSRIV